MAIFRGNGTTNEAGAISNLVPDRDYGDITVTAFGEQWTIDNGVVNTAKLGGDITTAGKALLDDASVADQRTSLELGDSATLDIGTTTGTVAAGDHNHSGVYEPIDSTILRDTDIGVSVQAYNSNHLFRTASTGSAILPSGTELQRDGSPAAGYIRFNTDANQFEGYNGGSWGAIGGGATGGPGDEVFIENDQTVTTNYTIPSGRNAMSSGPLTIDAGVTVTVSAGSTWHVL